MKRFVRSEAGLAYTLGAAGGLVVGFTDASAAVAYLIAFGLGAIGMVFLFGPERFQLWRDQDDRTNKQH